MDEAIKNYLSKIGEKGGCKSRRKLTSIQAKKMVKLREARKAYKKYYAQCFWSYKPDLRILLKDIKWVGEQLMKNGDRKAWITGAKLCR